MLKLNVIHQVKLQVDVHVDRRQDVCTPHHLFEVICSLCISDPVNLLLPPPSMSIVAFGSFSWRRPPSVICLLSAHFLRCA